MFNSKENLVMIKQYQDSHDLEQINHLQIHLVSVGQSSSESKEQIQ